jgi:nickel superoxide dismutase
MRALGTKVGVVALATGVLLVGAAPVVFSHCEIPCGIYGDPMRLDMMSEHIDTIEKSVKQIQDLSAAGDKNYNQLVRWVVNKEQHADHFSDIITQYFMKQRIKPAPASQAEAHRDYVHKLTLLHQMMVASMQAKQTTDLQYVSQMRSLLAEFRTAYLGEQADHAHSH